MDAPILILIVILSIILFILINIIIIIYIIYNKSFYFNSKKSNKAFDYLEKETMKPYKGIITDLLVKNYGIVISYEEDFELPASQEVDHHTDRCAAQSIRPHRKDRHLGGLCRGGPGLCRVPPQVGGYAEGSAADALRCGQRFR